MINHGPIVIPESFLIVETFILWVVGISLGWQIRGWIDRIRKERFATIDEWRP
jgi:hypothetical protein